METTWNKYHELKNVLGEMGSATTALSGGVDSGLLLKAASEALPGRTAAVTVLSVLTPPGDLEAAQTLARELEVPHLIVDFFPLDLPEVKTNSPDRCYACKTALARLIWEAAAQNGSGPVVEGSHAGDDRAFRPGRKALLEAGIRSPLAEVGLEKNEIRALARALGLSNRDRPGSACLATRFPYHTDLTAEKLHKIGRAEELLSRAGLAGVRARFHGDALRLEPPVELFPNLIASPLRERLVEDLTALGFQYITLDLAGYRSGVFDRPVVGGPHA
ncbi:MAG: ATP-dependent sacrificial sulfur transferase LarE [Pseudomonadota bacterium]